ncbi:MAG: hypothetical protein IJ887_12070 [Prevotella sp.]|nr:hypothetical protein [Prevotella sp.]
MKESKTCPVIFMDFALLKCKEKVQKKAFLKDDHLAQKPAQTACFLQESRFIALHRYPSFVQKAT